MRFLYFTDTHIRGTAPRNRKDNYYETLKNKLQEIKALCEELEIDYILHGGDWFDRPDLSPSIVKDFAVIIKSFNKPIYSIAGNHDLFGHNPDTLNRTMLGLLEGVGLLKLIGYDEEIMLKKDNLKVQLTGKSYNYDIDGEEYKRYYIVKKRSNADYAINIIHGMLLVKPFFEGIQYTLLEDIKDTEADITLAGHYHNGFGVKEIDSKYFVNPGSIMRITNTLNEMTRRPKVIYIELNEGINIKEIELKCALPGEEVLDREQLQYMHERNTKLQEFYQKVASTGDFKRVDLNRIIEEIASDSDLNRDIKDEAIRRIAIARENLSTVDEE